MKRLTPIKIVKQLDKYIIGQDNAKKAVSIALRNRWRRQKVKGDLQNEIMPNNIILIGPTGVGKTEIARRLSKLAGVPFTKVEASKFTEVGYVGRDVESMVRDLLDVSINMVRSKMRKKVQRKARKLAKEKILNKLLPPPKIKDKENEAAKLEQYENSRAKMKELLNKGKLKNREIEITNDNVKPPHVEIFSNMNMESIDFNIGEMLGNIMPFNKKSKKKKMMKVPEALKYLTEVEANKLINKEKVIAEAKKIVENDGIIFVDEIDKIASSEKKSGADVSRSGVQRDLLPIVEGSNIPTKYGLIDTSHILFIASGAFHTAKPSDLIPELQGRFPIRVELNSLTQTDFEKILVEPKNALTTQYTALFKTEKVKLNFNKTAIKRIAHFAALANQRMEDIGARRLHTVMNSLLEDYLFDMPQKGLKAVKITEKEVDDKLNKIIRDEDLSKYIL